MSTELDEFRRAVEDEQYDVAADVASDVLDEQDARADADRAVSLSMQAAVDTGDLDDDQEGTARTVARLVNEVEKQRAEFGGLVVGLARGEPDRQAILDTIDEIQAAQQRLDDLQADVREIAAAADLGPLVTARAPDAIRVPKGERGTAELTIRNVGSEPVRSVTTELESDLPDGDRLSLSPVDGLPVGTTRATLTCDTDGIEGRFRIVVRIRGDDGSFDSETVKLVVLDAVTYLELARSDLTGIRESVQSLDDRLRRSTRPFENKIDKTVDEIDAVVAALEGESNGDQGKGRSPARRLDVIEEHLSGLAGLVTSLNQVDDGIRTTLRQEVEDVERAVGKARRALS